MGDIALRGNKLTRGKKNLLEELGRVEGEHSNRNRRAEISRVHGELNRGYAKGGRIGLQSGGPHPENVKKWISPPGKRKKMGKPPKAGGPTHINPQWREGAQEGGRIGLKKGGKPWGTGPKPGTHDYLMQELHKPRKGKVAGGVIKGGVKAGKRFLDFIKTGKHVDKSGVKVNVPKAAERLTGQPHVDHGKRKRIKHLGRGKAEGGRIGLKHGFQVLGGGIKGKPHSTREGRDDAGRRRFKRWTGEDWSKGPGSRKGRRMGRPGRGKDFKTHGRDVTTMAAEGGRIGLKKGGSDKNWIQKAVNPKHKGFCTPMTKKTCTPRRKALAKTFKKMGRERKAKG